MESGLDPEFIKILVCPLTKEPLELEDGWLVCKGSSPQRRYPVRNGVPVLLLDEAEILDDSGVWGAEK